MQLIEYWVQAEDAVIGVAITTDNRMLLRQHLYRARAESGRSDLDNIVIVLPEKEDEIWLVHRDADGFGTDNQGHPKLIHKRRGLVQG